jgi:hypothetical protein
MRPDERAEAGRTAFRPRSVSTRGKRSLTIESGPDPVTNEAGEVIGIEVMLTLRDGVGIVPIDPHRVVINPPTKHEDREDPEGALWAVLWESVEETPGEAPVAVFRKAAP